MVEALVMASAPPALVASALKPVSPFAFQRQGQRLHQHAWHQPVMPRHVVIRLEVVVVLSSVALPLWHEPPVLRARRVLTMVLNVAWLFSLARLTPVVLAPMGT